MALGASDQYVRIYDRRMLGPGVLPCPMHSMCSVESCHALLQVPVSSADGGLQTRLCRQAREPCCLCRAAAQAGTPTPVHRQALIPSKRHLSVARWESALHPLVTTGMCSQWGPCMRVGPKRHGRVRQHATGVAFGNRGDKVVAAYHADHTYAFDISHGGATEAGGSAAEEGIVAFGACRQPGNNPQNGRARQDHTAAHSNGMRHPSPPRLSNIECGPSEDSLHLSHR